MKTADQIIAHSNVTEVSSAAAELYAHAKKLEAVAAAAKQMLTYIEMTMAHTGAMSVEQIMKELEHVKTVSTVQIGHHLGCVTTRTVNLADARAAIAALN